jgi:cholesterol transport system auxiliary component
MIGRPTAMGAARIVALVGLLAACGEILPGANKDPPKLYVLSPKSTFAEDLPRVDWQLVVDVPVADAALNTARIALRRNPVLLDYYGDSNWTDTAPLMVQTLLIESFENTRRIVGVGRQSVALRGDYSLISDLREFQAEYDKSAIPNVRVRLNAKLVKMPERVIVGSINAEFVEPAEGSDLASVVYAFDQALGKTLKRIVEWTLRTAPGKPGVAGR